MTGLFDMPGGQAMEALQNQNQNQNQQQKQNDPMSGGRRKKGSRRSRKGRKGRGGYLVDVLGATALLGATQFAKGRANYGYTGKNYYGSRKRRTSRSSRRSTRSRSR